jgi:hypothetical protein
MHTVMNRRLLLVSMILTLASPTFAEPATTRPGTGTPIPEVSDSEKADGRKKPKSGKQQKRLDENAPILSVDDKFQVDIPPIPPPSKESHVQIDGTVDTAFILGTEYGNTKADNNYSRLALAAGVPISRVVAIGGQVRLGVRDYFFDGDGQFIDAGNDSGEPFDELFDYSATLGTRIRLIDGLDLEVAGRMISRIEEGANFESGLGGGGSLSFLGRYQDWVVLRLGVALQSNFDRSNVNASPVFRLRLRLHERLWAETSGRNGRLQFDVTKRVRIDLFAGVEGGRYRLKDRHDGPNGVGEGSVRLEQTDVGLATRLRLFKRLRIIVEAGVVLTQTMEISDEDGDSFDERETREPAFRGRIALRWRF